jgi:hypothetical protein
VEIYGFFVIVIDGGNPEAPPEIQKDNFLATCLLQKEAFRWR